jgi:hypothetical protein
MSVRSQSSRRAVPTQRSAYDARQCGQDLRSSGSNRGRGIWRPSTQSWWAQYEDLGILGAITSAAQYQQVEHETDHTVETRHALILAAPETRPSRQCQVAGHRRVRVSAPTGDQVLCQRQVRNERRSLARNRFLRTLILSRCQPTSPNSSCRAINAVRPAARPSPCRRHHFGRDTWLCKPAVRARPSVGYLLIAGAGIDPAYAPGPAARSRSERALTQRRGLMDAGPSASLKRKDCDVLNAELPRAVSSGSDRHEPTALPGRC